MTKENEKANDPEKDAELADAEFMAIDEEIRIEEPASKTKPSRASVGLSMLALLLSGVAVTGVAYIALKAAPAVVATDSNQAEVDALKEALTANQESVNGLQQQLDGLANSDPTEQLDDLQQQFSEELASQLEAYESLPGRLSNIEDSMSSIQGISTGVRDNWLLAEAEYYMQIANAQLQLAGNPHLATLALLQADERILQLANPALTNVRRALAGELRALDIMSRPDVEGMTLTLASLANVVESLPIRQQLFLPAKDDDSMREELSGMDRAIASLKSTVGDVVSVRRADEAVRPLIAPESAFFLRANLSLQLQVARLALLRGEKATFEQSLDDANDWLGKYYNTESAQVRSARQTIVEVRNGLPDIELPDISESLRLLKQFGTLANAPGDVREPPELQPEP